MKKESHENPIHLRFDYDEALNSKKDILYSERSLITLSKIIGNYNSLKTQKLNVILELHKKLMETASGIRRLQKLIPDVKIPKILRKEEPKEQEEKGKKKEVIKPIKREKYPVYDDSIESQLQEIQAKLQNLQ